MIESCQRCGGLYATENLESFAGTPCRCPEPLKWSPTFGDANATAVQFTTEAQSIAEPERITAEMLLEQLRFIPDLEIPACCELHILEVLKTAIVNARADGHDEVCRHRVNNSQAARIKQLEDALRLIADDDTECGCECNDENCCAIVGESCSKCAARAALKES